MSLVLNTNINSLVAQNSLTSSGNQLATALQQLSSGLRINTAADDAAGYAIVQGMTSQINGLNQAAQNAGDGVSLAQTASGAMQEITNDLQSMRDLAVESLNASNGANDRTDLNAQFQQLMSDINSVSSQTQFNGVTLLDGTFQGATFQVGANVGQSITMASIASTSSGAIGNYFSGIKSVSGSVETASGTILNTTDGAQGHYSATTLAGNNALNTAVDGATVTLKVSVNGTSYDTSAITLTGNAATDLKSVAAAINQALSPVGGLTATVNSGGTGIVISGTTPSGSGDVVDFSVASATDAGGNAISSPGAGTLAALGVDSSDIIGYYTPSLAGGSTVPTGAGTYDADTIKTDLTGIKALDSTNTATVTLHVSDGTNSDDVTVTLAGGTDAQSTNANAIANALNGSTVFSTDGLHASGVGGVLTITGTSGTTPDSGTLTFSVTGATDTAGNTIGSPATDLLTSMGVSSVLDLSDSGSPLVLDDSGTAGDYSQSALSTDLSATMVPSASTKASVVLGVSLNDGTVIDTSPINIDGVKADDEGAIVDALNTALSGSGFTATEGTNGVTITGSGGSDATVAFYVVSADDAAGNTIANPSADLQGALGVDVGDTYTAGAAGTQTTTSDAQYLSGLDVTTVDNSNLVLISIDNALQQIATSSADLGAYQDRFQSAITGLNTDSTNLQSARSSIQDTDYAQATSDLSKAQIVQQASTAMVAQANTVPQNVLTLLQKLP